MAQNAINRSNNTLIKPDNMELPETDGTGSVGVISMQNSFSGVQERILHAGDNGQSGLRNIFVGSLAGNFSTDAINNVGVGQYALTSLASGGYSNTAVGWKALTSATSAKNNTAVGINAGSDLGSGESNIFLGTAAGFNAVDNWNIMIGRGSGVNVTNGSSNILVSNDGLDGESNTIRIGTQGTGDGQQNAAFIAGIQGVTPSGTNEAMVIDSNGQLGSSTQNVMNYQVSNGTTIVAGQGYIADNGSNEATFTAPSSPSIGDVFEVVARTSGGWGIDFNSGQTLRDGDNATSTGGKLYTNSLAVSVKIVFVGSGEFRMIASDRSSGTLTYS